jgi:catechol 2,3-dioxygenase-like lactoylglutathione lyase family enzyme
VHLSLTALVVADYDEAIDFFVGVLGFELVEDSPSLTNDGHPKRWVVVRPPGAETGLLLARADGPAQQAAIGNQLAGRVSFFLRADDFEETYQRLVTAGVELVTEPRDEPYGRVVVFRDIAGNKWDLLGAALGPHSLLGALVVEGRTRRGPWSSGAVVVEGCSR